LLVAAVEDTMAFGGKQPPAVVHSFDLRDCPCHKRTSNNKTRQDMLAIGIRISNDDIPCLFPAKWRIRMRYFNFFRKYTYLT
jgi:hypothetical protein